MDFEEERAIAKGKLLGFLLMSKSPLALNVIFAAEKLQLEPAQISRALWELSDEGRIDFELTRAIVTLKDVVGVVPPETDLDSHPDFGGELPPEKLKKGAKNDSP